MKSQFGNRATAILLIMCLSLQVWCKDVEVTVMHNDILSYKLEDLFEKQVEPGSVAFDRSGARINTLREFASAYGEFSKPEQEIVWFASQNKEGEDFRRLFFLLDEQIDELLVDKKGLILGKGTETIFKYPNRARYVGITNYGKHSVLTLVSQSYKDLLIQIRILLMDWTMREVIVSKHTQTENDWIQKPQTLIYEFSKSQTFFITYDAKKNTKNGCDLWYVIADSESETQGHLTLKKQNDFAYDDVTEILSVQVIDLDSKLSPKRMFIAYRTDSDTNLAACNLALENDRLKISDCDKYMFEVQPPRDASIKIPQVQKNSSKIQLFWVEILELGSEIKLVMCTLNVKQNLVSSCKWKDQNIRVNARMYDGFAVSSFLDIPPSFGTNKPGGLVINFRRKDLYTYRDNSAVIYVENIEEFEHIFIQSQTKNFFAVAPSYEFTAAIIVNQTEIAFLKKIEQDFELIIDTSALTFEDKPQIFNISDGSGNKASVKLNLQKSVPFQYGNSGTNPPSQFFIKQSLQSKTLPISRNQFRGNLLKFSMPENPDFEVLDILEWPQRVIDKLTILPYVRIYIAGPLGGIIYSQQNQFFQAFFCNDLLDENFDCWLGGKLNMDKKPIYYGLQFAQQAIASSQNYRHKDNAVLMFISQVDGDLTRNFIARFSQDGTDGKIILDRKFKSNFTDNQFIVMNSDSQLIFVIYDDHLLHILYSDMEVNQPLKSYTIEPSKFGYGSKWKVVKLYTSPLDPSLAYFYCKHVKLDSNYSRIHTIRFTKQTLLNSEMEFSREYRSVSFNNSDIEQFCNLGEESIFIKLSRLGKPRVDSSTVSGSEEHYIDFQNLGFSEYPSVICIPGSTAFIAEAVKMSDKKFVVVFGNRGEDIGNRFHSVTSTSPTDTEYVKLESAALSNYGISVMLSSKDGKIKIQTYFADHINGPLLRYKGGAIPETSFDLQISSPGNPNPYVNTFKLTVDDFSPGVTFKQKKSVSELKLGSNDLSQSLEITGHILAMKLSIDDPSDIRLSLADPLTLQYPLSSQFIPEPADELNKSPTEVLIFPNERYNIGYYTYPDLKAFNVYLLKEQIKLDASFKVDLGEGYNLNSETSICVAQSKALVLGAYASNNLSHNQITVFAKSYTEEAIFQQSFATPAFSPTKVKVGMISETDKNAYVVILAIDEAQQKALIIKLTIQQKEGSQSQYEVVNFTQRYQNNFKAGELVSIPDANQLLLIYSNSNSAEILSRFFRVDSTEKSGAFAEKVENSFAVQDIKCKGVFGKAIKQKSILCLISSKSTSLASVNIRVEGSEDDIQLFAETPRKLRLFGNYIPVSADSWFDKTIVKARAYDAQGTVTDEMMMLYSTKSGFASEYVVSAIKSSSYTTGADNLVTLAIPIVLLDGDNYLSDSKIAIFQSNMSATKIYTYQPARIVVTKDVSKAYSQKVKIVVNDFLGPEATNLSLKDLFTKPYTTETDSPILPTDRGNYLYTVLGLVAFITLVIIVVLLKRRNSKTKDGVIDEGDFSKQEDPDGSFSIGQDSLNLSTF